MHTIFEHVHIVLCAHYLALPITGMEYAHAIALSVNMYTLNCVHIERVQLLSKAQQLHCPWLSWPFLCLFCGLLHNPQKRLRQSSAHSPECIGMCRSRCGQLRCPQKRLKQVSTSSSECIDTCELRRCIATRYHTITSAETQKSCPYHYKARKKCPHG